MFKKKKKNKEEDGRKERTEHRTNTKPIHHYRHNDLLPIFPDLFSRP
jgi:hypothetical protein